MTPHLHLLNILATRPSHPQSARDEAYLAAAADLEELERRLKALENRGRRATPDLAFALGLR